MLLILIDLLLFLFSVYPNRRRFFFKIRIERPWQDDYADFQFPALMDIIAIIFNIVSRDISSTKLPGCLFTLMLQKMSNKLAVQKLAGRSQPFCITGVEGLQDWHTIKNVLIYHLIFKLRAIKLQNYITLDDQFNIKGLYKGDIMSKAILDLDLYLHKC